MHFRTLMRDRAQTRRGPIWSPQGVEPLTGTALLDYVNRALPHGRPGPLPAELRTLPDANPDDRWVDGGRDGVWWLRGEPHEGKAPALLAAALERGCSQPLETSLLHTVAARCRSLDDPWEVERLLRLVHIETRSGRARVQELARWLCRCGVHRRQVQVGVALLGGWGSPKDRRLIARLGILEPVTLFAVIALRRLLNEPEASLFDLAKQVSGWGVVHVVHALADSVDPQIQQWLFREDFANDVTDAEGLTR